MNFEERAVTFFCHEAQLYGVVSIPELTAARGVLIVTGGPQYRAGSHRQFTLLARAMAARGIPVMRFDYRGMGDSEGAMRNFEDVDDDLRVAIDQFMHANPGMVEVVVWGLCDAASAALFYASQDQRVKGLVLVNPWVRTEGGLAKATLKHYYLGRLVQRELWTKILTGRFEYISALKSFFKLVGAALGGTKNGKDLDASLSISAATPQATALPAGSAAAGLPDRMLDSFRRFGGQVLVIVCGADLTAREFTDMVAASRKWRRLLNAERVKRCDLAGADHTFSRRVWRDQICDWTCDWIQSW